MHGDGMRELALDIGIILITEYKLLANVPQIALND